jgi:hypothetical protein
MLLAVFLTLPAPRAIGAVVVLAAVFSDGFSQVRPNPGSFSSKCPYRGCCRKQIFIDFKGELAERR